MSVADDVYAAARRYGIDPEIFYRQMDAESGLNPASGTTSSAGARGIAQFMPGTAAAYGVNLYDDSYLDDLDGAARLMRDLLNQFNWNYAFALAGYNAGPGRVIEYGGVPPPSFANGQTYNYVNSILGGTGGAEGLSGGMSKMDDAEYQAKLARYNQLYNKELVWQDHQKRQAALEQPADPAMAPTDPEYAEMADLEGWLNDMDDWYEANGGGGTGGGGSSGSILDAYDYINRNNPEAIAAENAAKKYARELESRTLAAQHAAQEQNTLMERMQASTDSKNTFWEGLAEGRRAAIPTTAPARIAPGSELFQKALDTIKSGLPEVPDMPVPVQLTVEQIMSNGGYGGGGGAGGAGGARPQYPGSSSGIPSQAADVSPTTDWGGRNPGSPVVEADWGGSSTIKGQKVQGSVLSSPKNFKQTQGRYGGFRSGLTPKITSINPGTGLKRPTSFGRRYG